MAFLTWFALTLAAFALAFCAYLWFELQKRVSPSEISTLLQQYSDELIKNYVRQFHGIETEWADMYQKFSRLAGRVDREKALQPKVIQEAPPEPAPIASRADILKRWRSSR